MSEAALLDWCSKDETGASKSETEVSSTTQMTANKLLKGILIFLSVGFMILKKPLEFLT